MARVRIILEADEDQHRSSQSTRVYELGTQLNRLGEIEAAIERLKQVALPDLEAELLAQAQQRQLSGQKKAL